MMSQITINEKNFTRFAKRLQKLIAQKTQNQYQPGFLESQEWLSQILGVQSLHEMKKILQSESQPAPDGVPVSTSFADKIIEQMKNHSDIFEDSAEFLPPVMSTGIESLDKYYKVCEGQITIVNGLPGHGKISVLKNIIFNLVKDKNWNVATVTNESVFVPDMLKKYHGKNKIDAQEKASAIQWFNQHFAMLHPTNYSMEKILEEARELIKKQAINGLMINDYHQPHEPEQILKMLNSIKSFASQYRVHVWLVSSPEDEEKDLIQAGFIPTPYDISGSTHYRNRADNMITVWRNVGQDDYDILDVHTPKIREKRIGQPGVCSLRFDSDSPMLMDDIDQDKRRQAQKDGIVLPTKVLRLPAKK
jgi:KaiC/GvpD/RAD55 family RecA-like ATPase